MQDAKLLAKQWVESLFVRLTGERPDGCEALDGPARPSMNCGSALLMIGGHTIQVYGAMAPAETASVVTADPFVRDLLLAERIADAATQIHATVRGCAASTERIHGRDTHASINVRASSGRATLALSGPAEVFAALPWVSASPDDSVELIVPLTQGAPLYQPIDTSGIWVAPAELVAFWTLGGVSGRARLTLGFDAQEPASLRTLPGSLSATEPVPTSETTLQMMVRACECTQAGATAVQIPVEATAFRDGQPAARARWVQASGRYGVRLSVDPGFESTAPRRRSP